jgi:hypothetical protein
LKFFTSSSSILITPSSPVIGYYFFEAFVEPAQPGRLTMTRISVTVHTLDALLIPSFGHGQFMHQAFVAAEAVLLENGPASFGQDDRFMKILECESRRVPEAAVRFGEILPYKRMGQVALNAYRDRVMAGFLPGVEFGLHDVTIDAGTRIRAEIGEAFGIMEREQADAQQNPQQYGQGNGDFPPDPHRHRPVEIMVLFWPRRSRSGYLKREPSVTEAS